MPTENYYPNEGTGPPDQTPPAAPESPETEPAEKEEGPTALLPKSALSGSAPEVGEILRFKVVHVYDDEVAVEMEPAAQTPPSNPSADQEIDALTEG